MAAGETLPDSILSSKFVRFVEAFDSPGHGLDAATSDSDGEESALRKLLKRPSFTLPKLQSGNSKLVWVDIHVVDMRRSMYWSNSRFGLLGPSRLSQTADIVSDTSHHRKNPTPILDGSTQPTLLISAASSPNRFARSSTAPASAAEATLSPPSCPSFSSSSSSSSSFSSSSSASPTPASASPAGSVPLTRERYRRLKANPDAYIAVIGCRENDGFFIVPMGQYHPNEVQADVSKGSKKHEQRIEGLRRSVLSAAFVPTSSIFAGIRFAQKALADLRARFTDPVILQSLIHVYTDQAIPAIPEEYAIETKSIGLGTGLSMFVYAFGGQTYFDLRPGLEHLAAELIPVEYGAKISKVVQHRNRLIAELQSFSSSTAASSSSGQTLPNIHFLEEDQWHLELNIALTKLDPLFRFERVLNTEGLFRVPGKADDVDELCHQLTNIKDPLRIEVLLEDQTVIYTLADTFKRSIRHTKLELLPPSHLQNLIRAAEAPDTVLKKMAIAKVTATLPPKLQEVLFRLFRILNRVSSHSDQNKMDSDNLSILFTPLLTATKSRVSLKTLVLALIQDPAACFPAIEPVVSESELKSSRRKATDGESSEEN